MSDVPLISIITPCLNRSRFIAMAVESVMQQDYPHVEHIIVDGGSTDGTLGVLSRYPHLRVISEPDKNLYDAINKGIQLAKGEIIGHLNSDDLYADNVFGEVARLFREHPGAEVVCGGACVFEDDPYGNKKIVIVYNEAEHRSISFKSILIVSPFLNAKFLRRSIYEKAGLYNTFYFIAADREFLLRLAIKEVNTLDFNTIVYYYRKHRGSLTFDYSSVENVSRSLRESLFLSEAYLRNYGSVEEIRYYCKRLHTLASLELCFLLVRQKKYRESVSCTLRCFKYDHLWPVSIGNIQLVYNFMKLRKRLHTA